MGNPAAIVRDVDGRTCARFIANLKDAEYSLEPDNVMVSMDLGDGSREFPEFWKVSRDGQSATIRLYSTPKVDDQFNVVIFDAEQSFCDEVRLAMVTGPNANRHD